MTGKQFSSVWLREPRKATSPGLSREEIVNAAVALLDEEGLAGLSMRKLGARLQAGATSLYWYVSHKDELLELIYDRVWGEMSMPEPEDVGWREAASALARSMRIVMLRHPWSADLLGRMPALGPNALQVADRLRRIFISAGFEGIDVEYAGSALTAYIYGMTIPEVAWNTVMGEHQYNADEMRAQVARAVKDFPGMLERVNLQAYDDPQAIRETAFDFGLTSVLDGLERRLTT
ncbi:TetR/AcrR family transcriptional regulator [Nonomuraea sp. NPDC046802]|uniref:TetR/AcrR family transcriptional regulator n=1 Tax=Nonomuraea sp. NPDC046802 TaxID=3154919 RepID=UPI0033F546DB